MSRMINDQVHTSRAHYGCCANGDTATEVEREMLVASIKMEAGEKGSVAFGIHSDSAAQANVTFKISTGVVSSESPRLRSIATFH